MTKGDVIIFTVEGLIFGLRLMLKQGQCTGVMCSRHRGQNVFPICTQKYLRLFASTIDDSQTVSTVLWWSIKPQSATI